MRRLDSPPPPLPAALCAPIRAGDVVRESRVGTGSRYVRVVNAGELRDSTLLVRLVRPAQDESVPPGLLLIRPGETGTFLIEPGAFQLKARTETGGCVVLRGTPFEVRPDMAGVQVGIKVVRGQHHAWKPVKEPL